MNVKTMIDEFPRRLKYRQDVDLGYSEEKVDTKPLAIPFDCKKPETLEQMIDRILSVRSSRQLDDEYETEEESQDFEVDDEELFDTPYTLFDEENFSGAVKLDSSETEEVSEVAVEPTTSKKSSSKKTAKNKKEVISDEEEVETSD